MPFRSEEQRKWMWANKPKMARKWTDEHGSTPVKAKVGKYQELRHPQHDILPLEHMEESMSAKERVERLLDERKKKKESKKQLVKAAEGELVREKTRGTGAAVKGIDHYVMKGMDAAQEGKLIQVPTRGTGQAVKGDQHYVMEGMDAAKEGKMIKAAKSKWIVKKSKKTIPKGKPDTWDKSIKHFRSIYDLAKENKKGDRITAWDLENARKAFQSRELAEVDPGATLAAKGGPIKAKKGIWTGAATSMYDKPPGWDVKKISDKTHKKLTKLWKHREAGGWSPAAGKEYRAHLKGLKKLNPSLHVFKAWQATKAGDALTRIGDDAKKNIKKSKSYYFKDAPSSNFLERRKTLAGGRSFLSKEALKQIAKNISALPLVSKKTKVSTSMAKPSDFLSRRMTLGSMRSIPTSTKVLAVLKKIGKRTAIGKGIAAATVVAGAYEAGKRKLFTKDKDKKKVDKKSIGGETVVMKSGGGYIEDLL